MRYVLLGFGLLIVTSLTWANWPRTSLPASFKADLVVVHKAARRLELMSNGHVQKQYAISLGGNPTGPKQQEGDRRTPEGSYKLDYRKLDSSFHRALHISYPSPSDRQRAATAGVDPGSLIMVHGLPKGFGWIGKLHLAYDWTDGCVAVTNGEIREILNAVSDGTPIELRP